jgi:pyridoxine kinase
MQQILSVQSWVSFGHVGNAAAIFPLQRLGFEVWAIHTVQFSNHTGYGKWTGTVFPPEHLKELVQGMDEQGVLTQCDAVLSGYMGSSSTAQVILDALYKVRNGNKNTLYCCDPVMGDINDGIFVHPDIPEVFKTQVIPQADIITPNHFELELLTGKKVKTLKDTLEAVQLLRSSIRQEGPRIVLLTSLLRQDAPANSIETLVYGDSGAWLVRTPRIPLEPSRNGTGDAIAALFLGHYLLSKDIALSLETSVSALYSMLLLTHERNTREIQLVAAQDSFVNPTLRFKVEKIDQF